MRFSDGRGSLIDDKRDGRLSFKTSDVGKNEVSDVIDGDRRLTALFPSHSSETPFHLWLLFYPEIQFRSG
jgi:hypothetical protein